MGIGGPSCRDGAWPHHAAEGVRYSHSRDCDRAREGASRKTVIVGEAEALRRDVEDSLRSLVKELSLEDCVVFAGNQQKVAECLNMADVVVSANTRKPEAFGRSMAEALAMNRPVVAAAFGGALDIVDDGVNGVRVPLEKADAEGFAQALVAALGRSWGDVRTPALEKFSFERMIERSLAVYGEFQ